MSPREELEQLRKLKRLQELEARAGGGGMMLAQAPQAAPPMVQQAAAPQADEPASRGWADVPGDAFDNLWPSAKRAAEDVAFLFTNPGDAASGLGNIALGAAQKLIPGEQDSEQYADAVGQFFADRYGSTDALKDTMATDPVGFLADASTVLTGGGGLAARAPMAAGKITGAAANAAAKAGRGAPLPAVRDATEPVMRALGIGAEKVGEAATKAGGMLDPFALAGKGAAAATRGAGKGAAHILGMASGTGGKAVQQAAQSGIEGGKGQRAFLDAMRGDAPMEHVVETAREAVGNMHGDRSRAYTEGMADVAKDATVLDFGKVDDALKEIAEVKSFKGVPISKSTEGVRQQIAETVEQWRALDPAEYHTVEGFDALKQSLGDVLDSTQYGSPEWRVANDAYRSVKNTITEQAPEYAKVMKDYEEATALLKEIEGELSLGKGKNASTALRKLQAIVRNDVSSAYGRRAELGEVLKDSGAQQLVEELTGHAMSGLRPRGLSGQFTGSGGLGLGVGGLGFGLGPGALLGGGAMMAASSPRLVGEAAHAVGQLSRYPAAGADMLRAAPEGISPLVYQLSRLGAMNQNGNGVY